MASFYANGIVGGLLSLLVLRPIARRHVHMPAISRTGTDALVGRKAITAVDKPLNRIAHGAKNTWVASWLNTRT